MNTNFYLNNSSNMESLQSSNNMQKKTMNTFIISIKFKDGSSKLVTYVPDNIPYWEEQLKDAITFFSNQYKDQWFVETLLDDIIMNDTIPHWNTIKKDILKNETNDQVSKWLTNLQNIGTPSWLIETIRKDLQVSDNKKLLENYVSIADWNEQEKEETLLAMQIAIQAHEGQTQKRKKDSEWLDSIPYSNHPIQVANMALRDLKMSPEVVQACLLHDVVEDTEIELDGNTLKSWELQGTFSHNTIQMMLDCTKKKDEPREEFMEKMKALEWDAKIIKCIDRLHNIIRSFGIKDAPYIARYLKETKAVYLPAFETIEALKPLKILFFDLLSEMEKYSEKITPKNQEAQ